MIDKSQSGVSLYLAVIVMIILLSIVLGLTAILIGQMRMVREMGYSVIALSAADAGIERILIQRAAPPPEGISETPLNGATYQVFVTARGTSVCGALNFCIKSVGIYRGVRRAIEIAY